VGWARTAGFERSRFKVPVHIETGRMNATITSETYFYVNTPIELIASRKGVSIGHCSVIFSADQIPIRRQLFIGKCDFVNGRLRV
jgi:hypothetical protein